MDGSIIGFIIWALFGCFMIGLGISAFFAKKAVGFWANIKNFEENDLEGYNRVSVILIIVFGLIYIILCISQSIGLNSPYILLSVLGVMMETIAIMAIYSLYITKKYEK